MPKNDLQNTERTLRQVRSISAEFKTRDAKNEGPVIEGYFSVFNTNYELWRGAVEQIAPGAFTKSLAGEYGECDVRALANHDTTLVLGRTTAGTLTLREDEHGLFGTIKINEQDTDAMNLYARVQRGDVSQCSFGFDIRDEEFIEDPDGTYRWIIKDVVLYEVSVCTFPAYSETSVEARKADLDTIRKRENELWKNKMKERIAKCH